MFYIKNIKYSILYFHYFTAVKNKIFMKLHVAFYNIGEHAEYG